ncbi:unnamed protein product [Diatraea saccharalis]|uniref:Ig-like domain-containing protein n=1 Tax=Diatraea saccharalis TaxID=40085 RepID=A0A9N9R9J0_9NEOP|nr:unnamed protein product [Diatraea saccharalis]
MIHSYLFLHSYDGRIKPNSAHWADNTLAGRAKWHSVQPSALRIHDVVATDRALYRCRVDFKISPTRNHKILLDVIGKYPVLGFDNEKRLVSHILKLGDAGFPPKRSKIRQLAENLGLKHNFYNETKISEPQWLKSFLERNPEMVMTQAQGKERRV